MNNIERRYLSGGEGRAKPHNGGLSGYAAVFNSWSADLGGFRELIEPGAFAPTIDEKQDVRILVDHDPPRILGRTSAGTAFLTQDDRGLRYDVELPDTQTGRDIRVSVDRGDVSGSSFSFRLLPDGDRWSIGADDTLERRLVRVAMVYDVGPVTFPAYPATTVDARSLASIREALMRGAVPGSGRSLVRIARLRLEVARRR